MKTATKCMTDNSVKPIFIKNNNNNKTWRNHNPSVALPGGRWRFESRVHLSTAPEPWGRKALGGCRARRFISRKAPRLDR